ncbi:MAG: TonB-dependent receptor [Marinoscillum sp.]
MRSNSTAEGLKSLKRWIPSMFTFLLVFVVVSATAQERTVSGVITSGEDGSTLPGVTILEKGTTNGTITDIDGNYKISVGDGATIVVSFVGFKTQELPVGNKSTMDLVLDTDVSALEEVVVIGYGTQRKSDLTGAVASLNGDALMQSVNASLDQGLQGRVAGLQATQNSGQPGGAVSIRIRGTTSLTQSSEPLYVIDGIQVGGQAQGITGFDWQGGSGGQQGAASNPMASINPNDIASIEVLKDASATAIYGSRAANGVIIITTKRGKKGESKISYNGFYAVQDVYKTVDMMNLREYAEYNNEVAQEVSTINSNDNFADPSLLGEGTDWQEAIFRLAPMQSHSMTFTGGEEKLQYVLSAGYMQQDGIVIGSDFDRINVRLNVDNQVRDWLKIGTSMSLSRKDERIINTDGGDGVIAQAASMPPHIPVRNFDGTFAGPQQQNPSAQVGNNPVAMALVRNNTNLSNRVMNNLFAEVGVIDGLKVRTELAVDYNNGTNKSFFPTFKWGTFENQISQFAQRSSESFFWLWKTYATYNLKLDKHDMTVMAGYEAQRGAYEGFTGYKVNLPNDIQVMNQGDISNIANTGYKGWNALSSQFARGIYSFNDRYLVTGTIRRDGSSRFGSEYAWGWFPSASVGWRISNEPFMPQTSLIDNLKLRAGWGQVGNQEIANYAFGSALNALNTEFGPAVRNQRYSNPFAKWEATQTVNVGLDLGLFDGRLNLTFDAYRKYTNDLLLQQQLPGTYGNRINGPIANVGDMRNEGIEVSFNSINIDNGFIKWSSNANFSMNRNKILDLQDLEFYQNVYWYTGFQQATRTIGGGYPVGQFYGYVMEGIFTSKEEIENHAVQINNGEDQNLIDRTVGLWLGDVKWKDVNGDGFITPEDQTFIGDPNPDFTFGFSNSITVGPFTLDAFILGSIGGDILNYTRARGESMTGIFANQAVAVKDRARTRLIEGGTDINNIDDVELINPETNMPRFDNGAENQNHVMSTRWIEDGSYVRIQNLKLAYNLPQKWASAVQLSRLQVYANVQNVATFTEYTGLDPVVGAFNQDPMRQGWDLGRYPSPRIFTVGLDFDF